jgi:hypothetical protein
MLKGIAGLVAALAMAGSALAQGAVQQSGPVVAFHLPSWWQNGLVGDAGSPASPYVSSLGLFDGPECPFGISSSAGPGVATTPYAAFTVCQTNTGMAFMLSGVGQSMPYPSINAGWVMGGSPPTLSGSCSMGTQTGGNAAGTFKASGSCSGTVILTFSTTNPTGWACTAQDMTTLSDTLKESAYTATSVTFTATMANADVAVFSCQGF